jgi:hypothetical protein
MASFIVGADIPEFLTAMLHELFGTHGVELLQVSP